MVLRCVHTGIFRSVNKFFLTKNLVGQPCTPSDMYDKIPTIVK